ncbi:MAG: hypothetical protein IKP41_09200 [Bacteroidaceae bacterium]|nr:hypothetical protein [Bacteroidaceae bacterium]
MKKIMIWATLLVSVCACQNNPMDDELPMPSTFAELFEGIASMKGDVHVTISSVDSVTTNYYYEWSQYYEDKGVPAIEMDTTLTDESMPDDWVAKQKAIEDSVAQTMQMLRKYAEKGVKHLLDISRPQAAKYYRFECHRNGRDSVEFVLAPQELTDSLPEDCNKNNFVETYAYYPEWFHYYNNGDKAQNYTRICYHREERNANKKAAHAEDVRALFLKFISSYKDTKKYPVKYQLEDNSKGFKGGYVSFNWRHGDDKTSLIEGTLYELPVKGNEKIKAVEELRSMIIEFMNTHYAGWLECRYPEYKFDLTECDRYAAQLMQLSINNAKPYDRLQGIFHVQVGNYTKDEGLKILLMDVRKEHFFIPMNWMIVKEIHDDRIEWLPGHENGY